jgi:hypothetical protein
MNREQLITHHTIDEAHYGKTRRPPGPQILIDVGYAQQSVLPAITTPPTLSRYLLRSRHNTMMPFLCKLLPLPMNEFTSALFAVIASVTTSDIYSNNGVTVTFSTDPFGPSFPEPYLFPAFIQRSALICITMSIYTFVSSSTWLWVRDRTYCPSGSMVSGLHISYLSTQCPFTPSLMCALSSLKLVRPKTIPSL